MPVLTEESLRAKYLKGQLNNSTLKLPEETIITPAAKSYLNDKKIKVTYVKDEKKNGGSTNSQKDVSQKRANASLTNPSLAAESIEKEPEYMASLRSHSFKGEEYKRFFFRANLDSLQAKVIEIQLKLTNHKKLTTHLSEVIGFLRTILRAEETETSLGLYRILEMNESQILKISDAPYTYFGQTYFYPHFTMGEEIVVLNVLRTAIKETELNTYQAFKKADGSIYREDLLVALNRLSLVCWILMLRCLTGYYSKEAKEVLE